MRGLLLSLAFILSMQQGDPAPYVGTWTADHSGTTFIRLEIQNEHGHTGGRISLGNIRVDAHGGIEDAADASSPLTPLSDIAVSDRVMTFAHKDSDDIDRFELRLIDRDTAELRFVVSDAQRQTLADNGVAVPKPMTLKRQR